jgi:hypothetical protein
MKKVLLTALLVILTVTVALAATVVYINNGTTAVSYEGKIILPNQTITLDRFVYSSGLTVSTVTSYENLVIASAKVEAATPTEISVNMSESALVEIYAKPATSTWYMYFNHPASQPIILLADQEYYGVFNTKDFYKIYFITETTATSTLHYQILKK